jgi:hypothetical protein
MAKQLVSPIERHVEKVVLGLAGLLLIAVIARFLVTTPNRIEVRGEEYEPSEIDEMVADQAEDVQGRLRDASPPEIEVEARFPEFLAALDKELPTQLGEAVAMLPTVPVVQEALDTERIEPVEVVQLPPPAVTTGRSTLELVQAVSAAGEPTAFRQLTTNWAVATSVFDYREQFNRQDRAYQAVRRKVVVTDVQVQRRLMRPDGSWSEEDWEPVNEYRAKPLPPVPTVELFTQDDRIYAEPDSSLAVDTYQAFFEDADNLLMTLRPLPPATLLGSSWKMPIYPGRARVDVLREDESILYPDDPPSDRPEDRYPDAVRLTDEDKGKSENETPKEKVERLLREGQDLMKQASAKWDVDMATLAINRFVEVQTSSAASGEDKRKAERLYREARQLKRDITRNPNQGKNRPGGSSSGDQVQRARDLIDTQQVWVYDVRGGLQSGRTYQFRMRMGLMNRYAAIPSQLADTDDAKRVVLYGPWSEPSEPVYFEPHYYDFVTGIAPRGGRLEAKIELYRWFEGYWVETRERFGVGDWLVCSDRCAVPWREDPSVIDRPEIEFDSEAMLLDVQLDRPHWERKRGRGAGTSFRATDRGSVVVIVGEDGEVREHFESTERDHPQRRVVKSRVYRPPASTKE